MPRVKKAALASGVVSLALLTAACGSSGKSSTAKSPATTGSSTTKFDPKAQFTLEIDQEPTNWNDLSADGNEEATINVADRILPSVFHTYPDYSAHLDTSFVTSAVQTSTSPQTIVYKINPKAVWGDGVPITEADFAYNYQAQSGLPQYTDAAGKAYAAAANAGYNQIKTVSELNNDPKTVSVVFSKPFADWKSLFTTMVPAHISSKIGFNDGFTDPVQDLVSGGPFMVSNYSKGTSITLVRNPKYWGPPANLSSVTFRFLTDSSQIVPALQNNEIQGGILTPQLDLINSIKQLSAYKLDQRDGLEFEHLDFNQSNQWLKDPAIRQAIMLSINRQTLIAATVGQFDSAVKPLNDRMFVPGQPGFQDNSGGQYTSANLTKAMSVLTAAGYTMSGGQLMKGGQAVKMRISSTAGNQLRSDEEQFIIAAVKKIGITATETDVSSLGDALSKGTFDMIVFAWVATPFPSGNDSIYQTADTSNGNGGSNFDGYTDPKVDSLIQQADNSLSNSERLSLYNQVDKQLWDTYYNLPLFQRSNATVYSTNYENIQTNATAEGTTYNMEYWGKKAAA